MSNPEHLAKLKEGVEAWNCWREENQDIKPDLSGAHLPEAKLEGVDFREADLRRAWLWRADLRGAKFQIAELSGVDLPGAKLWRADFRGARLWRANLRSAKLEGANLSEADLWKADLRETKLEGTNLQAAYLKGAKLWRTEPRIADPTEADLCAGTELRTAPLRQAIIREAKFWRANLRQIIIREADSWRASLRKVVGSKVFLAAAKRWKDFNMEAFIREADSWEAGSWEDIFIEVFLRKNNLGRTITEALIGENSFRQSIMEAIIRKASSWISSLTREAQQVYELRPGVVAYMRGETAGVRNDNFPFLIKYVKLDYPKQVVLNQGFDVIVELLIDQPEGWTDPLHSALNVKDPMINQLSEIEVVLSYSGFDIEGGNTQVVTLERDNESTARFSLVARKIGRKKNKVWFYQNDRLIGKCFYDILVSKKSDPVYEFSLSFINSSALQLSPLDLKKERHPFLIRYPNIFCSDKVALDQRFSLIVELSIDQPEDWDESLFSVLNIKDFGTKKLPEIEVVLSHPGFDIEGSNTQVVEIERNHDSTVRFVLFARQLGQKKIKVWFYQNGKPIGKAFYNILVSEQPATVEVPQPEKPAQLEVKKVLTIPPQDLELLVDFVDDCTLSFRLHSVKQEVNIHNKKFGPLTLHCSPLEKMQSVYKEMTQLAQRMPKTLEDREWSEHRLAIKGNELWDELIPEALKQEYWKFKSRVTSVLITSEEPWIPWEIIKPYSKDEDQDNEPFWCQQFAVSRWLSGAGMADELDIRKSKSVAPIPVNLPSVKEEIDFLNKLPALKANITPLGTVSRRMEVLESLKNEDLSLLHFACHGIFDPTSPNDSAIKLSDGNFRPSDIPRTIHFGGKKSRP
ncbi:MAG: pentapeptide repeat-containing protein, partial [Spirulinaceae cyanobacterium]